MIERELEEVACVDCGKTSRVQRGSLTEDGKRQYLCRVCREVVLELRQAEKNIGDRKLLID